MQVDLSHETLTEAKPPPRRIDSTNQRRSPSQPLAGLLIDAVRTFSTGCCAYQSTVRRKHPREPVSCSKRTASMCCIQGPLYSCPLLKSSIMHARGVQFMTALPMLLACYSAASTRRGDGSMETAGRDCRVLHLSLTWEAGTTYSSGQNRRSVMLEKNAGLK